MSYILDALRRSERERRPNGANPRDPGPAPLPPRLIAIYAVPVVALVAVAIGIYFIFGRPFATSPAPTASVDDKLVSESPTQPAVNPPAPAAKLEPSPVPRVDEATKAAGANPASKPPSSAFGPRVRNLAEQARVVPPPRPPQAAEPRLPGTVVSVSAPPPAPIAKADPVKLLRAMPPEFQRALPELVVTIHVYAPNESERILYINNREYHAGDKVRDDIVVERIVEDGAVLNFRGERFKLPRPS